MMGIWRVIGSTRLHNQAARIVFDFNSTSTRGGNKLVGVHNKMGMKFASKFIGALVVKSQFLKIGRKREKGLWGYKVSLAAPGCRDNLSDVGSEHGTSSDPSRMKTWLALFLDAACPANCYISELAWKETISHKPLAEHEGNGYLKYLLHNARTIAWISRLAQSDPEKEDS
eukprot:1157272-Pelagomonas_calceolata.AAC.6